MLVRLGVTVLVLNLVAAAIAFWSIAQRRELAIARFETTASNLVEVLASELGSILDKSDLALQHVIDAVNEYGIHGPASRKLLEGDIAREMTRLPGAGLIRIADARGDVIVGHDLEVSGRISIAHRPYFRRLRQDPGAGLVISEPLLTPVNRRPAIVLARAFRDARGAFAGVVFIVVSSADIEGRFAAIDVGTTGAITLRTADLALVARHAKDRPATLGEYGSTSVPDALRDAIKADPDSGTFLTSTPPGNVVRANAYHMVKKHPLYVIVELATHDMLVLWQHNAVITLGLLALFVLTSFVLSFLVYRSWLRRDQAIAIVQQQEAALHESAAQLRGVLESTADAILAVDRRGKVLQFNRRFGYMWNIPPEVLATRDDQAFLHHKLVQLSEPDEFLRQSGRLYGSDSEGTDLIRFKDGRMLERHSVPLILDGNNVGRVWSFRDVTERDRMLDALQASEERYRETFEFAPVGVVIVAPDHRFIVVNRSFCELLGYSREELLGITYDRITYPDSLAASVEQSQRMFASEIPGFKLEKQYVRKDGSAFWANVSAIAVRRPDGTLQRVIAVIEDIDRRKRAESELEAINLHLEAIVAERTKDLVEANAELQTITYTLAHDLRAPARHVAGFAAQLSATAAARLEGRERHWLELMSASANRQAQLVEDMLGYIKLGLKALDAGTVDMDAVVAGTIAAIAEEEPRAGAIDWRIAGLPPVEGDRALVQVIFANLIANAVKFSAGSTPPVIEVGSETGAGDAPVYFVRDNGVGFDFAQATGLFGLFRRFHDDAAFPGTGIGLAIVKRLVERHGGRLWAASAEGAGATFYFTLQAEDRK
jgi:PAS domain S-box-containing protein